MGVENKSFLSLGQSRTGGGKAFVSMFPMFPKREAACDHEFRVQVFRVQVRELSNFCLVSGWSCLP